MSEWSNWIFKFFKLFIKSQKSSIDKFVIRKHVNENLELASKDDSIESNDHFDYTSSHLSEHDIVLDEKSLFYLCDVFLKYL